MATETITAGPNATIAIGNGNNTVNVTASSQDAITVGNGSNTVTVTGGSNDAITIGNGDDKLTETGASGDTIVAGNGNDTVTVSGGSGNNITVGNGNVTVIASGDHNDVITLGMGNDTAYLGANDTVHVGKGSNLLVLPPSTPTLATTAITVSEDQLVNFASLGINAGFSASGFGQENIYGFAAADQLEFTTAQFANFAAVMADATQQGQNTVITDSSSDTIVLENVAKSSLSAKNFVFANAGSSSGNLLLTISGLPSDLSNFSGGSYTASTGTWTGTSAQFNALTFKVGEEIVTQLTVTETDTVTGNAISKTVALNVTPPTITIAVNGTAQENQVLTAVVGVSNGDAFGYQWQRSADGGHTWSDISNATGMSYTVQEGDEAQQLRVKATLVDDGYSVASTSTSAVLDAAPTVTTPIVTGTAQEGQTLTASASSGQSDNPVTYAWYSSADGYTNAIGSGATYVVQEADEGFTIEAKATATNDNGATTSATSAATGSVIDNASLSLSVKDLTGVAVAQGHVMVASATITGDADDAAAPVTYQWQSSSNGGATWTNVAATTSGLFGGVLSSFYQFGEQDEGNIFRIVASFTDDTGQVVTATSAPTTPVADIAPIVTQPFSFALDEFKVVKGANTFDDTFTQGPPPVGGFLGSSLVAFNTNNGSIVPEVNGKAILTATGSTPNATLASTDSTGAVLLTNTAPEGTGPGQSEGGLKEDQIFTMSGTYDLAAPGIADYGIELLNESASGNTQVVQLVVQGNGSGGTNVDLYETNLVTGVHTLLTGQTLTAQQMANNTQIELDLAHNTANSQVITGSFELFDNGTRTLADTFSTTATEFNSTTFVQAAAFASSPPSVAITGTAQEGQTLTAIAVTNDSDATINYQWQSSSNGGATWTPIAGAANSSAFVVQESDEGHEIRVVASTSDPDSSQSATATSAATGPVIDALPTVTVPVITGTAQEGQTLTASASSGQSDNAVTYAWYSSTDGFTNAIGSGATYLVKEGDEGFTIEAKATATNDNGATISATSAATLAVLDAAPIVTTPIVTGTAQEGQTLTASASSGQSDNAVTYAWYSSTDGFTNPIGSGATYLVKEGDEGFTIEAKATATNDNGATISATSAATLAVLDAAPTVTTPIVTGTAQEGQTLTASASSGQSDNPVTYAWYSSADGYTNAIGSGATYVVQEADEGFTIEAKATATNDNGATTSATSAATGSVIDNASLSLSVKDLTGVAVAQGHVMVASATITGDADDAAAPVTYQWQSSSNGGATWTNVAATTSGLFGGVLSSFYQFGEQDEGNIFRIVASFTDDTGQVVTATSAPTTPVADIAPIVTQPFSFALDEFKVVKGANTFDDTFTQGPPPVGGFLGSSLVAFNTNNGSIVPEVNGKAILTATGSTPNATLASTDSTGAVLLTNTAPEGTGPGQSEGGLKEDQIFTMSGTYDLAAPGIADYGIELLNESASGNTQVVQLVVQGNGSGGTNVDLYETNLVTGVHTLLTGQTLTAQQMANNTQIELDLAHNTANSQVITGSFELFDNGTRTLADTFSTTATEFNSTTFVQAAAFASSPPSVAITGTAQEGQTLTAIAVTNDSDATINYQWQSSSNGGATWTPIAGAANSSAFVVQESDEGHEIRVVASTSDPDSSQSATATSAATGPVIDALPTVTVPVITGTAQEGQTLTASASSGQSDNAVTYAWYSSTDGFTNAIGSGATYLVKEGDEGFTIEAKATATNDNGATISATSAATLAVLDAAPIVTTPIVTGTAQEGQTLTASASSGQSDNAVTYAWYSSTDGFTNPIGSGATYLVKEGDEGFTIEAKATATNDNGATISATSAATLAVLDAAPTVTTPIVTGTAQEGQTLTASASSGQSDNPVTYAWYSSADGYTNAIGSGATYVVQEADEGFTIEAKATATNDNGATTSATSAMTAAVFDNSSLSLTVSVVDNLSVQQGQTLVASAIPSDADDAGATVTYQWQSSSDNGGTWTNVAASAAGNFDNGVPSSFYQLSEGDEGKVFRATASFTDDTGQVVTTTSAPSVAVADVTPEITVPFTYTVSDLSIVKNGTQIYDNTFSQAPPASPTILSNGVPTPIVFLTLGGTWTEAGSHAVLSSTGVAPNPAISGGTEDFALLDTNTDPTSTKGLKLGADFAVSSTFGLTTPPTGSYGMELNDGTPAHGVDQLVRMIVTQSGGNTVVELVQRDLASSPQTTDIIASQTLTTAQLAGNNQIEFQLSHVANTSAVSGSFELIDNGTVTSTTTFAPTAPIFTGGVDWTRVDIGAFTNPGMSLNVGSGQSPKEGQTFTASATTNDSDATLHYQWQSSADAGATWTAIAGAVDSSTYVAQQGDENHDIRVVATTSDPDSSQSATATSAATGPVIDNATLSLPLAFFGPALSSLPLQEGDELRATAAITGDTADLSAPINYQWQSSSDNGVTWTNVSATAAGDFNGVASSFYELTESDEGKEFRAQASFTDHTGQVLSATSASSATVGDITPIVTAPFSYAVDEFKIVKGDGSTFDDTFTQGPPPVGGLFGTTLDAYGIGGTSGVWTEVSGKAIMSPSDAVPSSYISGEAIALARLLTSTQPQGTGSGQSNSGLKENASFTVSATFDLVVPPLQGSSGYGIDLSNFAAAQANNEEVQLYVRSTGTGGAVVDFLQSNPTAGIYTLLASQVLTAAQLANNTQIELDLAHNTAGSTVINASFELLDNGTQTSSTTFAPSGHAFNNQTYTRADFFAFSDNVTISGLAQEGQTLTANAATNDSDATLHYQWQESASPSFTTVTNIGTNSSTYVLQNSDLGSFIRVVATTSDPDNPQNATVTSAVTGAVTPIAPSLSAPSSVTVNEGGTASLGISEMPFNPNDTVSITITGVPSDASLSAGTNNGDGSWTLTPAQLAGLTLTAGEVTSASLMVTATNTAGQTASTSDSIALTVNPVAPVLGGTVTTTATEGTAVTLGVTNTAVFGDDILGGVIITGLPANSSNFNGGSFASGTWTGTAAQFNALAFTAGNAGDYTLSISATTNGATSPATENYTLTINQAAPVLGGATSKTVTAGSTVTLGVTEVSAFSDDMLGNVTITGLPSTLIGFNGGTYTASSGTWVGTAAQFNALSFATTTTGTSTLSISATTTGADAGSPATESYTLTVSPAASPKLTTLASFNGSNGEFPLAGLTEDANGNLFGTTEEGGTSGVGMVFELKNNGTVAAPSYASTPSVLVSFNGGNGKFPQSGLTADANGDLFGTTDEGGASNDGTVFEIKNNGTVAAPSYAISPTVVVSFNGGNGAFPEDGLTADANGDLFGTTESGGGANNDGTVFELKNNGTVSAPSYASTPSVLVSFNGGNGEFPIGGVTADANGDLFGTTEEGGTSGDGTVFEIKNNGIVSAPSYASTPSVLVSFNGGNGEIPTAGLTADAKGDLFGTTEQGGASGVGTVFELKNNGNVAAPSYASTPSVLVSFNGGNGEFPLGGLIIDGNGDLFGTTDEGGTSGDGTVFEIKNNGSVAAPNYAAAPTTLTSFNNTNGSFPIFVELAADASGNLLGTTEGGGASGAGTVFEITNSGFAPPDPLTIADGKNFDINAASEDAITFGGNSGTLTLDQSQGFVGTIAGFGGQDQIDLSDIAFGANTTLGYAANNGNTLGVLMVSDGTHTANIALLGQYTAASFATASDGYGGTMITEPAVTAQTQLTPPHA